MMRIFHARPVRFRGGVPSSPVTTIGLGEFIMTKSTGLRLALFALAASTSLSGLAAQTAPGGRPVRPAPAPSATPTPTPAPGPTAQTAPAPIRIRAPQPAATPAPAPAPATKPAAAPVKAPVTAPATTPAKSAPAVSGPPKVDVKAPGPAGVPANLNIISFAERPSDAPRGAANEIVPSSRQAPPRVPDQVEMATGTYRPKKALIKPGRFSDQLKSLGPTRGITLAQLQSNPRLTIGKTKVDMTRVLANPQSVINRATALSKLTDTVRINNTTFEATEVKSGLIVRSFVNYSLRPGACTVQARRAKLEAAGVSCAKPMTKAERDKAYSTPGNQRYIADPAERAKVLAAAEDDARQLAQDAAALRADLKIPQLRAEMVAAIGEAEVKRLESLSDADLAAEIANSGDTKMEDVSYIPVNDLAETFKPAVKLGLVAPPPPGPIKTEFDLGTQYFLAGFTLGREYEWRLRVEQRIKRCLIGCEKTYYVEAFAGFNYGLGLRFPIEVTGKANSVSAGGNKVTATVTPQFRTFDGGPEQYLDAGLPPEKLFGGKEFVAQFGAHAGFGFDVPFYPSLSVAFAREIDFTDYLKGNFKGGNFPPPNPPKPGVPGEKLTQTIVIDDVDLIGGRANFGFVGAQVFPAANIILTSNELSFTVADKNGGQVRKGVTSGQSVNLNADPQSGALEFDIKDPIYNLELTVEPGINARVFVDIGLWGKTWDMPVFFPSLAISLPSGGVNFACHDGTKCSRDYSFTPNREERAMQELAKWAHEFESWGFGYCRDYICEQSIRDTRIANEGQMRARIQALGQQAPATLSLDPQLANILTASKKIQHERIGESFIRRFGIEFEPTFIGKCADPTCTGKIKALRASTEAEFKQHLSNVGGGVNHWFNRKEFAETMAMIAVRESLDAKFAASPEKWIKGLKDQYVNGCQGEHKCNYDLALLADAMGGEAVKIQGLNPNLKKDEIIGEVTKMYKPRFEKILDDFRKTIIK